MVIGSKEPELPKLDNLPLESILKPKIVDLYQPIEEIWKEKLVQKLFDVYKNRLFYIYD